PSPKTGFVLIDDRHTLRFYSHIEEYLECAADRLAAGSNLDAGVEILQGDNVAEALDTFCGDGNALVVATRARRAGVARWWNGSVSNDLARGLRAPLLIVPHSAKPAWMGARRILVPLKDTVAAPRFAGQLRPL